MAKPRQQWIEFLYGPFLKVISFIYRIYRSNRDYFKRLTTGKTTSSLVQFGAVILLLVWILVWLFASDESRGRFTQEVKESFDSFKSQTEN